MSSVPEAGPPQQQPQTTEQVQAEIQKAADARKAETWKNKSVFSKEYLVLEDGNRVKCRPLTRFEHFKALFGYGPKLADVMDQVIGSHHKITKEDFAGLTSHYLEKKFEKLNKTLTFDSGAKLSMSDCISAAKIISVIPQQIIESSQYQTKQTINRIKDEINQMPIASSLALVKEAIEAGNVEKAKYLVSCITPRAVASSEEITFLFETMKLALEKKMFSIATLLNKNFSLSVVTEETLEKHLEAYDKLLASCGGMSDIPENELVGNLQSPISPKKFIMDRITQFRQQFATYKSS
mgnify:CR=1 FL=1